ncbi:MAG: inositol monophosphatase family protein [Nakamurella sp.]
MDERKYADIALRAALAGADAIEAVRNHGRLEVTTKSAAHDLVTAADRAAEQAILDVLSNRFPDDAILGEETGNRPGKSGVRWLVDPLDGTANFVHGRSAYAVSVGAERDGEPFAGAIVLPEDGRWITGGPDGAASGRVGADGADVESLQVRDTRLADALVTFGLPSNLDSRRRSLVMVADISSDIRGVRVMGCAAGDLAAVALGHCNGFVGIGLAEWDTAAGHAIVLAAGGTVHRGTDVNGQPVLIAGSAGLVAELTGRVITC